jgi:hypothetical protein
MRSHSQLPLFFITNTSYNCVILVIILNLCYEHRTRITKVLIDLRLNIKTVNSFKEGQYETCLKDLKYNIYIVALVKMVKL